MHVILMERIEKLGQMGDIVSVKAGYARNYLLPQKKAVSLTEENKAYFETQRAQLEVVNLERKTEAEGVAAKLNGLHVVMIRQAGETGHLYGSVKSHDISAGITTAGFTITRQQVSLTQPIKLLGLHSVQVALHPEVNVSINVNVARSEEEAEIQYATGKAVIAADEDMQSAEETGPTPQAAEAAEAEVPEAAEAEADAPDNEEPASMDSEDGEKPDTGQEK